MTCWISLLGKAKYNVMTTLDNSSAFWSILLHPDAKPLTAFGTRSLGHAVAVQADVVWSKECYGNLCKGTAARIKGANLDAVCSIL